MASAAAAMLRGSHDGNDPFISTSNYPNHGKTNCSNKLETDKKKDLGKRTSISYLPDLLWCFITYTLRT